MPPVTGRTGADAIMIALKHICRTITKYQVKLGQLIDNLETDEVLTSTQATVARTFISGAVAACAVFEIIAANSGF